MSALALQRRAIPAGVPTTTSGRDGGAGVGHHRAGNAAGRSLLASAVPPKSPRGNRSGASGPPEFRRYSSDGAQARELSQYQGGRTNEPTNDTLLLRTSMIYGNAGERRCQSSGSGSAPNGRRHPPRSSAGEVHDAVRTSADVDVRLLGGLSSILGSRRPELADGGTANRGAAAGKCVARTTNAAPVGAGHGCDGVATLSKDVPRRAGTALLTCVAQEQNAGYRAHMEDTAVVIDPYLVGDEDDDGERWGYFGVYDGHGGRQAVDYCEEKLHEVILNELRLAKPRPGTRMTDDAVAEALSKAFRRVDDQLKLVGAWRCGCTATVALTRKTPLAMRLHVANVGDSRGVVVDSSHVEWRVSQDHRPMDFSEMRRIEGEGGFVARGRVSGQLGVSRALGDHALKNQGVSWKPYTCARDATHDTALVLASDGVWDAMGDADARLVVQHSLSERIPEKAAHMLLEDAQRRGSTDNITCLVAFFAGPPNGQ
mmetsp:Transcript_3878/g.9881  ORF Transcript_3878/g.9881 Transcript_3878/m.9881 type:complete len:485 (-) Transcript_3878:209-1663(-)